VECEKEPDVALLALLVVCIIAVGITIAVYNYKITEAYLERGFIRKPQVITTETQERHLHKEK